MVKAEKLKIWNLGRLMFLLKGFRNNLGARGEKEKGELNW
jgi:hypothetical protein